MKSQRKDVKKKPLDYPDETKGSRLASEIRQQTNKLTSEERRKYFQDAMAMIYGGEQATETARAGH
jgi:hypothetical protein